MQDKVGNFIFGAVPLVLTTNELSYQGQVAYVAPGLFVAKVTQSTFVQVLMLKRR